MVPISDTLLQALIEAAENRRTDWVVEWAGKKAGNIKKAFERACQRAGLEGVTPHVLRHTAATRMAMAGFLVRDCQDAGTHKLNCDRARLCEALTGLSPQCW